MKNSIELMSPAGDWPSLRAAIKGGCNAVYFGVRGLNMRARAKNFKVQELQNIMDLCRESNIKGYLALNTIVYNDENKLIDSIITEAAKAKVDGIIGWDFAVAAAAKQHQIPFCVSTQMSVSNSTSLKFIHQMTGARRFVLARECTLAQIKKIYKEVSSLDSGNIELEVFIHGAMCVSVSGRCFLSHDAFGKSANRGECAQPCRRSYHIQSADRENAWDAEQHHLMSPKDLCGLPLVPRLINAGVKSFKIEGRNRGPEYVRTVTSVYREAIDWVLNSKPDYKYQIPEWMNRLKSVYNRDFSSGFYLGKPANEWTLGNGNRATHKKTYVGHILKYYPKATVALAKIEAEELSTGDLIHLESTKNKTYETFSVDQIQLEQEILKVAPKGSEVTFKVPFPVKAKDRFYVMRVAKKAPAKNIDT